MMPVGRDMLLMTVLCGNGVSIDTKSKKICFNGIDCIKYRTEKQFEVAYEILMKVIELCRKNEKVGK
jgi:hypothetical protein